MLKVSILIKALKTFPEDAECYAYEGEICGVVVVKDGKELGYIELSEKSGLMKVVKHVFDDDHMPVDRRTINKDNDEKSI